LVVGRRPDELVPLEKAPQLRQDAATRFRAAPDAALSFVFGPAPDGSQLQMAEAEGSSWIVPR
jgi:hypothetical protein